MSTTDPDAAVATPRLRRVRWQPSELRGVSGASQCATNGALVVIRRHSESQLSRAREYRAPAETVCAGAVWQRVAPRRSGVLRDMAHIRTVSQDGEGVSHGGGDAAGVKWTGELQEVGRQTTNDHGSARPPTDRRMIRKTAGRQTFDLRNC